MRNNWQRNIEKFSEAKWGRDILESSHLGGDLDREGWPERECGFCGFC